MYHLEKKSWSRLRIHTNRNGHSSFLAPDRQIYVFFGVDDDTRKVSFDIIKIAVSELAPNGFKLNLPVTLYDVRSEDERVAKRVSRFLAYGPEEQVDYDGNVYGTSSKPWHIEGNSVERKNASLEMPKKYKFEPN